MFPFPVRPVQFIGVFCENKGSATSVAAPILMAQYFVLQRKALHPVLLGEAGQIFIANKDIS
jgi:hypothetical protein